MEQVYQPLSFGASPVDLSTLKTYLKITSTAEDALLQSMLDTATSYGEQYTGREFRANQWELLLDEFTERIGISRDPVDTIDSIDHLVSGSLATIPSTDYYLKRLTFCSEILLATGKGWPTNTDPREQAIVVTFTTKAYYRIDSIKDAILRHVAYWYANRGDCSCGSLEASAKRAAELSGASALYDQFRIPRI